MPTAGEGSFDLLGAHDARHLSRNGSERADGRLELLSGRTAGEACPSSWAFRSATTSTAIATPAGYASLSAKLSWLLDDVVNGHHVGLAGIDAEFGEDRHQGLAEGVEVRL